MSNSVKAQYEFGQIFKSFKQQLDQELYDFFFSEYALNHPHKSRFFHFMSQNLIHICCMPHTVNCVSLIYLPGCHLQPNAANSPHVFLGQITEFQILRKSINFSSQFGRTTTHSTLVSLEVILWMEGSSLQRASLWCHNEGNE